MLAAISTVSGPQNYATAIKSSTNTILADEPLDKGGNDLGFNPFELLAASLGACTSITLRMYAERKGWDLQEIKVDVNLDKEESTTNTIFNRSIQLVGNLDETQRQRLLTIANQCPVHKILTNQITINSILS